jgi:ubiquinone/menaquinone biosynthesis C-methylase UbiE
MKPVDYDLVAASYDRRFERNRYDGIRAALARFLETGHWTAIAEIGCGTGHWLAEVLRRRPETLIGLDISFRMLEQARITAPAAMLLRGTADQWPLADASLDRIFCINALHHFRNQATFIAECRRVLKPGGGLITIGLDPHHGGDQWWVYDFFPAALHADRERYPASSVIRDWLRAAGFDACATEPAQRIPVAVPFAVAVEKGFVDRQATSQLMVISDEDFELGMNRLIVERPVLRADLTLYATTAWKSADRGQP